MCIRDSSKGVAWSGLTNVTETPSGAEQTDLYADNIKYLSLTSAETFEEMCIRDRLRRVNNRLRLEKEYRQLTQTRMERYRAKAGKVVEEATANTLQNAIQKGLKKAASRGGSAAIKGAKRFKR